MRSSWDEVFNLPVLEFLNVICYNKDKANFKLKGNNVSD